MPAKTVTGEIPTAGIGEITDALRRLLADVFTLFVKTKSFHWHVSGRHFRSDHLLLDEHAGELMAMVDDLAERARKLGGTTIRSIDEIARTRTLDDGDDLPDARGMLDILRAENARLAAALRTAHEICDRHGDIATASLIENWVDQTEKRVWFLREIVDTRE